MSLWHTYAEPMVQMFLQDSLSLVVLVPFIHASPFSNTFVPQLACMMRQCSPFPHIHLCPYIYACIKSCWGQVLCDIMQSPWCKGSYRIPKSSHFGAFCLCFTISNTSVPCPGDTCDGPVLYSKFAQELFHMCGKFLVCHNICVFFRSCRDHLCSTQPFAICTRQFLHYAAAGLKPSELAGYIATYCSLVL